MSAPFIGSRISLISKSDVRYEGILCGIDTNESKVYLQHVRCFGTEDRRKDNPIAPASEVYEVIIFHSSDIKDLSVCELPPPVAYDPMNFNSFGVMGSGYNPPQYPYPPMVHPQYGPQYGYPYNPYHHYGMYPQSPSMGSQDGAGFPPNSADQENDKSSQPPQKINVTTSKVESSAQTPSSADSHKNNNEVTSTQNNDDNLGDSSNAKVEANNPTDDSNNQKSNYHKNPNNNYNKRNNNNRNNNNNNFVYLPKGEAKSGNNQSEKSNDNAQSPDASSVNSSHSDQSNYRQNNHNNQDYRQKRGSSNNRGYKGYSHNNNNNNNRRFDTRNQHNTGSDHSFHKSKEPSDKKSQEDFDFLISNAKFEKLSISEEEKDLPKVSPSYNKESFYDNISCDTLDREESKEKKTYYEQRKLDSETFGDLGRRTNRGGRTRGRYDTHSQGNSNQKRYNNNNYSNRGNRNYTRGNRSANGSNAGNTSDNAAQN